MKTIRKIQRWLKRMNDYLERYVVLETLAEGGINNEEFEQLIHKEEKDGTK